MHAWTISPTQILSRREIAAVLRELTRPARSQWVNNRLNLVLFRLSCCCGLRVTEALGLRLQDVKVDLERPYIQVRVVTSKGRRAGDGATVGPRAVARRVPLWWDRATLDDLAAWKREREQHGAGPEDLFVCSQADGSRGKPLTRGNARRRFIVMCAVLGPERQAEVTFHTGRHSFVSHALAGGRSLAEVRDAAGHRNISTTSIYTHVATDDNGAVGQLFDFDRACGTTACP